MAPKIPMRDPDLQVAEQKKPELMSFGPERFVLLMSKQLAEAVEGDFVRPLRPQLLAVRPREFPGEQRSIRLGPPAPIRFAVQRLEHRVELGTLQPGAVAFRESTHTLLYGPIAARPQPCRPEQPPCRLVRIRVRRPRERVRRPQPDDGAELLLREQPLFHQRRHSDGERVPAEERRVVRRGIVRRRLSLRPELEAVESELGGETEKSAAPARERRPTADVVARIAWEREVVNRKQQPADPERPQRLAHELAQRVQPFSATGTSHTVPSGGNVRSADCGWPSQGTSSTAMRSGLPTPEPP